MCQPRDQPRSRPSPWATHITASPRRAMWGRRDAHSRSEHSDQLVRRAGAPRPGRCDAAFQAVAIRRQPPFRGLSGSRRRALNACLEDRQAFSEAVPHKRCCAYRGTCSVAARTALNSSAVITRGRGRRGRCRLTRTGIFAGKIDRARASYPQVPQSTRHWSRSRRQQLWNAK